MVRPGLVDAHWHHFRMASSGDRRERLAAQDLEWTEEEVRRALAEPVAAVALLVDLANAAPNDSGLAYLGAGPIEDLLIDPAPSVGYTIELVAPRNARFHYALRCAWFESTSSPPSGRDFGPWGLHLNARSKRQAPGRAMSAASACWPI